MFCCRNRVDLGYLLNNFIEVVMYFVEDFYNDLTLVILRFEWQKTIGHRFIGLIGYDVLGYYLMYKYNLNSLNGLGFFLL